MTKIITPPALENLSDYQRNYIQHVTENNLLLAFDRSLQAMEAYLNELPESNLDYRYANGKLSVREVLRHLVESEMIFGYRALRCSRMDQTPLSGYDENAYINNYLGQPEEKETLRMMFRSIRQFNILQFAQMSDTMLDASGQANGRSVTARILGFMMAGHQLHHLQVLVTRYQQQNK